MDENPDNEGLVEPSCWDACCLPARTPDEFTRNQMDVGVTNKAIFDLLRYNQSGILVLVFLGAAIVATWLVFSVVPGFALFDGASSEISAVSHIGWWVPIEVITLVVGGVSVFLSFQYNSDERIEASITRLRGWLVFYIVVLALAIVANMVHLALSAVELSNCTSTLCTTNKAFLVVLLVFLVVLAFLEAWAIYRVVTFSTNLKYAFVLSDSMEKEVVFNTRADKAASAIQLPVSTPLASRMKVRRASQQHLVEPLLYGGGPERAPTRAPRRTRPRRTRHTLRNE